MEYWVMISDVCARGTNGCSTVRKKAQESEFCQLLLFDVQTWNVRYFARWPVITHLHTVYAVLVSFGSHPGATMTIFFQRE